MLKLSSLSFTLLSLVLLMLQAVPLSAQDTDFQTANRHLQQQNFEEARVILQQLYQQNPGTTIFLDRYLDSLIGLGEYEEALSVIDEQLEESRGSGQLRIRQGELNYLAGRRNEALHIWDELLGANRDNIQIYYQIGSLLMNHREYERASNLYESAREAFGDESLFINEVAASKMQSGDFAGAIREYFRLIRQNPNQVNFVQQRLLRMQDREMLETAATELSRFIGSVEIADPSYPPLHQLYIWLLVETEQYQVAVDAARQYESGTESLTYALFSLADKLVASHEYELAADAFRCYLERAGTSVRTQALDRLSRTYMMWADFLSEHHLEERPFRDELVQQSYETGVELLESDPGYTGRDQVIIRLVELSLDHYNDTEQASAWIDKLENEGGSSPDIHYLKGRLHLYSHSWTEARQAFTRANRTTDETELAEKSRYFLSLTDFLAGDYEFAQLQLRQLEGRYVSWYANDALQLRLWIQQGEQADTTGQTLQEFGNFYRHLIAGSSQAAVESLEPILDKQDNPLAYHAVVQFASKADEQYAPLSYTLLHHFTRPGSQSPLRERLMWERAVTARQMLNAGVHAPVYTTDLEGGSDSASLSWLNRLMPDPSGWPSSLADVEELFEQLIIEFPQGFYAPYAREELQNLTQLSS